MRRLLLLLVCLLLSTVATAQDASEAIDLSRANVMAWNPTGQYLATGHYNGGLALWDGETGALVRVYSLTSSVFPGMTPDIYSMAWNPAGTRLTIRLFYPDTGSVVQVLEIPDGTVVLDGIEGGAFSQLALSPDGTQLAVPFTRFSNDRTEIRILDASSGQLLQTLETPYGAFLGQLGWNSVGTRLAVDYATNTESGVMIWDTNNGEKQLVIPHPTTLNSFDWSPNDDRIASAANDNVLRIWDTNTGQELQQFKFDVAISKVDWHPSEDILAIQKTRFPLFVEVATGKVLQEFSQSTETIVWKPDGTLLAGFRSAPLFLTRSGEVLPQYPSIIGYKLIDNITDQGIASISDDDVIDLSQLERVNNLVVQAASPRYAFTIKSIIFELNGQQIIDSESPFEIPLPPPGDYTLTGTPYTEPNGKGQAGTPLTVRFTVVEGSAGN